MPPSECLSTGAEATESEICVAPLNVEKTSAPAFLLRDGYRVRAVGSRTCRGSTSAGRLRSYGLPREYMHLHEDAPAKASKTATTMNPVGSPPDGGAALPRAGEPVVPSAI